MKKTFTLSFPATQKHLRTPGAASFFVLSALIVLSLFLFSAGSAVAQSISASVTDMVPAGDLADSAPAWKKPADYANLLTTERANTAQTLANPGLKTTEKALYTGYDRMLGYMQVDLANNVLIEEIASNNFKKVLLEAPADPVIKDMVYNEFNVLYQSLVNKLTH